MEDLLKIKVVSKEGSSTIQNLLKVTLEELVEEKFSQIIPEQTNQNLSFTSWLLLSVVAVIAVVAFIIYQNWSGEKKKTMGLEAEINAPIE
ncbi:MAG: hypothetical protein AAF335_01375 [Bacteroidota bacterium]